MLLETQCDGTYGEWFWKQMRFLEKCLKQIVQVLERKEWGVDDCGNVLTNNRPNSI